MQRLIRSTFAVNLGLVVGRILPAKLGYALASFGARRLARKTDLAMVNAVRANQTIIRGEGMKKGEIDQAVEDVFVHAGRCFIDLYHHLKNPLGLKQLSPLNPTLERLIAQSHGDSDGAFIVAPHLSNFDLVLLAAAYRGLKAQVLTYGNPTGGYEIQNDIRAQTGLNITPVNPEVHRHAVEKMKKGGFVITAIDRPIRRKAHTLNFFGRPSPLPAGHISMALEANVPIIVVSAEFKADHLYHVNISEPIELIQHDNPDAEIRINAEVVLRVVESYIRSAPGQWLMYYPAWPNGQMESI